MSAPVSTPDEQTLREFLLGLLPPDRAERVAAWLASDRSAAESLRRVAADDLLTGVLADSSALEPVSPPSVERVIQSVCQTLETVNLLLPASCPTPAAEPETLSPSESPG